MGHSITWLMMESVRIILHPSKNNFFLLWQVWNTIVLCAVLCLTICQHIASDCLIYNQQMAPYLNWYRARLQYNSCGTDTDHFERTRLLQPPQFVVILINKFRTEGGICQKDQTPISIENNICINGFPFLLLAIIHHHGITIRSGHYTT